MAELIQPNPLPPQRRRVLLLAMSPAQLLDVAGPLEVLAQAGRLHAIECGGARSSRSPVLYDVAFHIAGGTATSAGLDLASNISERALLAGPPFDTLIVVGGEGARRHPAEPTLQRLCGDWRRKRAGWWVCAPAHSSWRRPVSCGADR